MGVDQRILMWGIGGVCDEVLKNGIQGRVTGFIETSKSKEEYRGLPVYDVDAIPFDYDRIIVANKSVDAIYKVCLEKKIDLNKCIFLFPIKRECGNQDKEEIRGILGEKNYTNYCAALGEYCETFFEQDLNTYQRLNKRENFTVHKEYLRPIISDKYAYAGTIENYFWQDLWAAKLIGKSRVKEHFDIGSRVDGFIAHLLVMGIDVTMIDVRDFPKQVEGLHTIIDDATTLRQIQDESIESLSAMCSLEHFGLGRYGDPIDPEACFKCFGNIQKKLKKRGHLYLSVPVGKERVEFNAHRVFYASTIKECFHELQLQEFSCTSQGELEVNVDINKYDDDPHNGEWRYGLFHFFKAD